jgi:hypothetical protein
MSKNGAWLIRPRYCMPALKAALRLATNLVAHLWQLTLAHLWHFAIQRRGIEIRWASGWTRPALPEAVTRSSIHPA